MRNFWDEDPSGDDAVLWFCGIAFACICLYSVLL